MPRTSPAKTPKAAITRVIKPAAAKVPSRMPIAPPRRGDLDSITDDGTVPLDRVRDSASLYRIFTRAATADLPAAHNRGILQEMIDGAPPHKDAVLQSTGQGWCYNLNFLEGETHLTAALTSYDDLIESVENLIKPTIKHGALSPEDKVEAEDIIAEEWTTMERRDWPDMPTNWTMLANHFIGYAVGFATFPDTDTWKWEAGGWDDFLMPRKTKITDESVTTLIGRKSYRADELYKYIADKNHNPRWNRDEVIKALVKASLGVDGLKRWRTNWPGVEKDLRENGEATGVCDAELVNALLYWVREYDGSYSYYIGLEDGSNEDHLYAEPHKYKKANEAFVSFTFNVGKGTFHSVRGLAWKMFPFVQVSNRVQCNQLNSNELAASLLLQPVDGESLDDLSITLTGPVGYLPPADKATIVERTLPNVGQQSGPLLANLDRKFSNATGQYQAHAITPDGQNRTKYEIQAQQEQTSSLGSSAVNRFYRSMDRLKAEQFRRVQNIGPSNKDFPEVKAFYDRCAQRGVPAEIIRDQIEKVVSTHAIGNGSASARLLALDELNGMSGALDDTGRALAARDRIALRFGRDYADRYKPKVARIAPDTKVAQLENALMQSADIQPQPDENNQVHLEVHVPALLELVKNLMGFREQNPQADFRQIQPQLDYAHRLHTHSATHLEALGADPSMKKLGKSYSAALQQMGNALDAFARQVDAQNRKAQDDQQQAAQAQQQAAQNPQANQPDPAQSKLQMEMERHQLELRMKQESHTQELQQSAAKFAQETRLRQIEADFNFANGIKKAGISTLPSLSAADQAAQTQQQ